MSPVWNVGLLFEIARHERQETKNGIKLLNINVSNHSVLSWMQGNFKVCD